MGLSLSIHLTILNKTGLQLVSRPMEKVHYFGGWVEGDSILFDDVSILYDVL